MQEDGRAFARLRPGVIPVGYQDDVVKRIGAAQGFMACAEGRAHRQVIGRMVAVVAPKVLRPDRLCPRCRTRQSVRPIGHRNDAVDARRGGAVAFALGGGDTAAPDGAGQGARAKA